MTKIGLLLVTILALNNVESARILGIFHAPAPSHYILGSALMRALAEKGHDVTVVSAFGEREPPKGSKYRDVVLTGVYDAMQERTKKMNMFEMFSSNNLIISYIMSQMGYEMTVTTLNHENFQNLLKSNETFDLVIMEPFLNEAFRALSLFYGSRLILLSTLGPNPWINNLVANPAPPSYVPEMLGGSLTPKMNFWQRLKNAYIHFTNNLFYELIVIPQHKTLVKEYFPDVDVNLIDHNVDLILLNSHPSLSQPVPLVPNMIEIGGFHIKPPKKLPKDLQQYLDNAKNGFIYFSMGSNIKSIELPIEKRNALLNVFGRLKLKVLWKWEEDNLPGQPDNVKIIKWAPQRDLLAHPNIKVFITHGGLLSTTETIYHGVPILALPVLGDQDTNAKSAVNNGFGLSVRFMELTEEILEKYLNELLQNPKYAIEAKKRSAIFHDRQLKPLDRAIYWVEYVLRHNGAPHLMVEGINLPWYKYYLLDVLAFVTVVLVVVLAVSIFALKAILSCICKRSKKNANKNKKDKKGKKD